MKALAVLLLLLSGCAANPYFTVGVGHQIDKNSDWYVSTEREWQCHNPQGHFELGVEKSNWTVGYHHQSWWGCGGPFNNKPELYQDDVRLTYKFGGEE